MTLMKNLSLVALLVCHLEFPGEIEILIWYKGTLKDMVYLAIPGHRKLTGVGVKKLVQSLPRLAELNIDSCPDVGKDAVEWATRQGVKVKHQIS